MGDKGDWPTDQYHDDTVFVYNQLYKLDTSCVIELEPHVNADIHQMAYIEKGLIQIKFKFSVYKYSQFNLHWYLPLSLLGFNPEGHYVVDKQEIIQINDVDNDPMEYHRLLKPKNLMINAIKPSQDQLNRGIQPYIVAHGDPINASSKMYNHEATDIVTWTRMELSDDYQDSVLGHFITQDRPDEYGENLKNLYYQIKDITSNRFKLIEIYEHQDSEKLGIDKTKDTSLRLTLKRIFVDDDMQMTHITKEAYPETAYKPGESRALLEYTTKRGHAELIILPLLALCVL